MSDRLIDEAMLIDVGLLCYWDGVWKYKLSSYLNWFTANTKDGAIEMASKAYANSDPNELLTKAQRSEKADREEFEDMHRRYGRYTVAALQDIYSEHESRLPSFQKCATREFSNNATRRNGPAVAAEGCRDTAEFMMQLKRYINSRINEFKKGNDEQ